MLICSVCKQQLSSHKIAARKHVPVELPYTHKHKHDLISRSKRDFVSFAFQNNNKKHFYAFFMVKTLHFYRHKQSRSVYLFMFTMPFLDNLIDRPIVNTRRTSYNCLRAFRHSFDIVEFPGIRIHTETYSPCSDEEKNVDCVRHHVSHVYVPATVLFLLLVFHFRDLPLHRRTTSNTYFIRNQCGNTREQKNERERSKQMYSRLKPRSRQYLSTHSNDTKNGDTKERNSLFNDVSYCGFVIHLVIIVNNKFTTQYSQFRLHRTHSRSVIHRIHNSLKNYLNRIWNGWFSPHWFIHFSHWTLHWCVVRRNIHCSTELCWMKMDNEQGSI